MTAAPPPGDERVPGDTSVLVVTGMSGAGRSTTAHVLEDLDYFVVDNLPPKLLWAALSQIQSDPAGPHKVAVVVDVRTGTFFADLVGALEEVREQGVLPTILFLEADDTVLVRRFESVRRPHPLQGAGRVVDGIRVERELVEDLRGSADLIIDTSMLNVHDLARKLVAAFGDDDTRAMRTTVLSFGFKYGIPVDADLVFDARFLPNPFWVPQLRDHSGLDADVSEYVMAQPAAAPFLEAIEQVVEVVTPGYLNEGKRFLTIAVGCTGGKHRSVATAEELARRLRDRGLRSMVVHRDLGHE